MLWECWAVRGGKGRNETPPGDGRGRRPRRSKEFGLGKGCWGWERERERPGPVLKDRDWIKMEWKNSQPGPVGSVSVKKKR